MGRSKGGGTELWKTAVENAGICGKLYTNLAAEDNAKDYGAISLINLLNSYCGCCLKEQLKQGCQMNYSYLEVDGIQVKAACVQLKNIVYICSLISGCSVFGIPV